MLSSVFAFLSARSASTGTSTSAKSLLVSFTSTSAAPAAMSAASSRLSAVANLLFAGFRNTTVRCTNPSRSFTSFKDLVSASEVEVPASCIDSRRCAAFARSCLCTFSKSRRLSA